MLPAIRNNDHLFKIPLFDIKQSDVNNFLNELSSFHENFQDCFHRSESRGHFFRYMVGQFSSIERKSIEPIALSVEGGNVRAMQRFISDAHWDENKIQTILHTMVGDTLGDPNGAILFDETGFLKKGTESIGVARQYCGTIGKVDNCQVGVFAAYVSHKGYSLIDKELYIPQKWFTDEFEEKRRKCNLPGDMEFQTKPKLAATMLEKISNDGIIPFKYVLADSIYGENLDFIEAVEKIDDAIYFVSIPSDTQCWRKRPVVTEKQYKYRGEIKTDVQLAEGEKKPITIQELGKSINNYFWYRRTVSEGTKGPVDYEFTKRRIVLSRKGTPNRAVWLIIKRSISTQPEYSYFISNAPVSTRLNTFVWLSGLRWAIEQCFEETKSELGMDHYEVRKFTGWHHHILVCMLAHFFLWLMKIKLGKKSSIYYFVSTKNPNRSCFTN